MAPSDAPVGLRGALQKNAGLDLVANVEGLGPTLAAGPPTSVASLVDCEARTRHPVPASQLIAAFDRLR